jgi:carboxypeptidase family protein/TonB-dependent receptor-like protein
MTKRLVSGVVCLITALISGGVAAYGQQSYGALLGQISDQQGASVPGAKITVTSEETGLARTVATDGGGNYRIGLLAAGNYSIKVEATGFGASEQKGLALRVGDERRVDVRLRLGEVSASVTIEAPITDSATSTLSTVVPAERVNALPLNGRQLQELALTAPGVTASGGLRSSAFNQFGLATPTDGNAGAFNVNGAPSRANGFFLDGVDINVPEQGVIAFPPLIEATREFQVQTSLFNAEYGRFSGSIVSFVTKSGTNQWHGSAYEYFRNDALDANDFFNNSNGLPRTVLKQNQFGVSVGGPIHRNSHFVFGNWEANKLRQGTGPFASNVPTATQRSGLLNYTAFTDANGNGRFDAGEPTQPATLNLAGSVAPISRAVLDGFIPLPNASVVGANYIANGIQKMDEDAFAIRTDHSLTSKDQVSVRYAYDDQRQFYPFDIFFTAASLPAFPFPNPERRQSVAVAHTHLFGSSVTNEFRFGLNRQRNPIPNGTEIDPASIGLPNGVIQNEFGRGLPIIRVTGFGGAGGQPFTDNLGASTTYRTMFQFIDNISVNYKQHSFKFGGEVRRSHTNQSQYRPLRGALNFSGARNGQINQTVPGNAAVAAFADFLLGLPAQITISSANPTRGFRTTAYIGYAQDEWRVNSRLVLNLGLRYEIDTPVTEVNGLLSNLLPGRGNFVVGSDELPRLHNIDKNNFAPRVGFAYRATEDGKWTVRGGAGVYHDNGTFQDRFRTARSNAPFAITNIVNQTGGARTSLDFPLNNMAAQTFLALIGGGAATGASAVDVNYRTPYAIQYNLNVQHELDNNLLAEVAYVGRRGLNASRVVNINQIAAVNSLAVTQLGLAAGSRPFNNASLPAGARFANDVISQQFNGQATYHSLQTRLERRLSSGASFLASYTWSKSIDNVSGIGTGADDLAQDSYNLGAQRAASNFDVPHKFVFSSTWALPIGRNQRFLKNPGAVVSALVSDWQINGILTYQSGQPFTVTVGAFDAGTGISNRRPNQVSDPKENVPAGFAFNPAAFVAPPAGQLGSVGRNALRADNYFNTDFAALRNFRFSPLGEAGAIEFRAEFFNLFNSHSFTLPVSSLSNAAFGRYVSNSTAPRVIQFVAKVKF